MRGVDLDVLGGVVMGVIGPAHRQRQDRGAHGRYRASGSGKTTLLLNRLWELAPGAVLLDGRDVCGLGVRALRRRRVGTLF